ncbi:hypothetical protein ILUMI_17248 [Ignelater luminosus]|uniref:Uncharacterized protein n=1 Tax=Ignelater luminosus TaxID=2038154 RepID=A0A8K0CSR0_IGNLU|nr:hypothetical protein ILUMI_17248 [Ignelater luminosus]
MDKKYNLDSLQQESTKYLYQSRLNQDPLEIDNQTANKVYKDIVDSIKKAAREALGTREIPKSNEYWWNPEIEELIEGKKKLDQKWLNTKDQEDYRKRQEIKTNIGGRKCSEVWKFINKVKTNERLRSPLQLIPVREWVRHYEDRLTDQRPEYAQITPAKVGTSRGRRNIHKYRRSKKSNPIAENWKIPWPRCNKRGAAQKWN